MAGVVNVGINVDARGARQKLRAFAEQAKRAAQAVRDLTSKLRSSKPEFSGAGESAKRASKGFDSLAGSLRGAVAGYASFATAQSVVNAAISRTESERRIKLLAKGYGEVDELAKAAADASVRFGQSQTTANKALANVYARLRPVGTSLDDIVSTYNGFNTAARLSGASAIESENAFTQLAQALGSGALRGDEFNSISEQVPAILTAISKETGIAQGQLRKYAAEGKITADVVLAALKKIEQDGGKDLEEALKGPEQQLRNIVNRTEDLQVEVGKLALPALLKVVGDITTKVEQATTTVENLVTAFSRMPGFLREALPLIDKINQGLNNLNPLILALNVLPGLSEKLVKATEPDPKAIKDFDKMTDAQIELALAMANANNRPKPGDSGKDSMSKRKDISEKLFALEQQRQSLAFSNNELLKIEVDRQIAVQRILDSAMQPRERAVALQDANNEAIRRGAELMKPIIEGAERLQQGATEAGKAFAQLFIDADNKRIRKQAENLNRIYRSIGSTISSGIVDGLSAAVDGTKELADVASDVLRNVANILIQFGVQSFLGGLGGGNKDSIFTKLFGGGRANGGPVSSNRSYLVGERGPELFVPKSSGTIVPNGSLSGGMTNVTVNVDASGSNVQGDSNQASQLGKAIGAAVQAELVKQKRPGGLLAGV